MQLLAGIPLTGNRILLPSGHDHASAQALLSKLLSEVQGPAITGLFGEPKKAADRIDYFAPDGRVARYEDLDQVGRDRLRAEIGRLISLLRRAAEQAAARDPAKCGTWPALVAAAIEIPSFEYVFAHEGRPVLAGWGLVPASAPAGLGLLRVLDDGLVFAPARPFPWLAAGATALVLLAVGALGAFLTPMLLGLVAQPAPVCRIADVDQKTLNDVDREKKHEQQLRQRLASLNQSLGQRRQGCPIPVIPAPRPPAPLPADRWAQKDLSMLQGCWRLGRDTQTTYSAGGGLPEICGVKAGSICFGSNGGGERQTTIVCPSAGTITCKAPITARFGNDDTLGTTQPAVSCSPPSKTWNGPINSLACRRVSDTLALCRDGTNNESEFIRE